MEGSGVRIVVIAVVGALLLCRAIPALRRDKENFFSYSGTWVIADISVMNFGIFDLLQVTVLVSLFALILVMSTASGVALFITQYAPRRVVGAVAYSVDLLAVVPSIICGVWGWYVLAPQLCPITTWLDRTLI